MSPRGEFTLVSKNFFHLRATMWLHLEVISWPLKLFLDFEVISWVEVIPVQCSLRLHNKLSNWKSQKECCMKIPRLFTLNFTWRLYTEKQSQWHVSVITKWRSLESDNEIIELYQVLGHRSNCGIFVDLLWRQNDHCLCWMHRIHFWDRTYLLKLMLITFFWLLNITFTSILRLLLYFRMTVYIDVLNLCIVQYHILAT